MGHSCTKPFANKTSILLDETGQSYAQSKTIWSQVYIHVPSSRRKECICCRNGHIYPRYSIWGLLYHWNQILYYLGRSKLLPLDYFKWCDISEIHNDEGDHQNQRNQGVIRQIHGCHCIASLQARKKFSARYAWCHQAWIGFWNSCRTHQLQVSSNYCSSTQSFFWKQKNNGTSNNFIFCLWILVLLGHHQAHFFEYFRKELEPRTFCTRLF